MHKLLNSADLRAELISEGEKHVENFTDETLRNNLRRFYEKVLEEK